VNNQQQIEEWFLSYGDNINNFLVYYTGSSEVEDMVQETFLRAMRGMENFKGKSSPKAWLSSIARNVAIDFSRKQKRTPIPSIISDNIAATDKSPEETVVILDSTREVLTVLQQMNQNFRNVLTLRGIQGLSSAETASILGWSQTRVNVTYHRAIKAARSRLNIPAKGRTSND